MSNDRETVVVSGNGGSGAGWFLAGIIVLALVVVGFLYFNGTFSGGGGDSVELTIEAPEVPVPEGGNG